MIRRFTVRRPGRAWEAIRQDEDVAALMGVNTLVYKLWSFVIGAAVAGAAGVIYASKVMVISPDMFKFDVSILILACVVFGGIGNIWGVVLGASHSCLSPRAHSIHFRCPSGYFWISAHHYDESTT